jgi:hypothetical protein
VEHLSAGIYDAVEDIRLPEIPMKYSTHFRILGLPIEPFRSLFALDDAALAKHGACRRIADSKPGFPCRVSLVDAEPGERLLLLPYKHHDVAAPYQASGPIYVREVAREATPGIDEVPEVVRGRLMSVRAYDGDGFMQGAEVTEGRLLEETIERFFGDARVAYLHLHNARPGCYSCRVDRVTKP